jgi:hypothetical protein
MHHGLGAGCVRAVVGPDQPRDCPATHEEVGYLKHRDMVRRFVGEYMGAGFSGLMGLVDGII